MSYIHETYPVSPEEFQQLETKVGDLIWFIAHRIAGGNRNDSVDFQDIAQELRIAAASAVSYYKRQCYIQKCLELLMVYILPDYGLVQLEALKDKWDNRTRHGANQRKFGLPEELELEMMACEFLPDPPGKDAPLIWSGRFEGYVKSILWNRSKALGRKITQDRFVTYLDLNSDIVSDGSNYFLKDPY